MLVLGFLRSTTSLGWNARQLSDAARSADLSVYGLDVAGAFAAAHLSDARDRPGGPAAEVSEGNATLLVCINPDQFTYAAAFLPSGLFENKYVIGWCVWELERIPDQWLAPLAILDEIWVPSDFVRRAFVASGVSLPCRIFCPNSSRRRRPARIAHGSGLTRTHSLYCLLSACVRVSSARMLWPRCELS